MGSPASHETSEGRQAAGVLRAVVLGVLVLAASGCASVVPSGDYSRARALVHEATGQHTLFRPGEEEQAREAVDALLVDGLTSTEAVQVALLNNQQLQSKLFDIGLGHADAVQAGLLSNPSLQLMVRLPLDGGSTSAEGGLLQNLADLWRVPARKRVAKNELERTILAVAHQAATLAAEAKADYISAATAAQSLLVAEENLDTAQQFYELSRERLEAGGSTQVEVNAAHSRLLEQRAAAMAARFEATQAKVQLSATLGLQTSPQELELTDAQLSSPGLDVEVDGLLASAATHRLDLQSAAMDVEAAERRIPLERRRVWRSVRGGATFETEGSDVALGPGIGLTLPIFDQNQAQIAKAELLYEQSLRRLDGVSTRISQQVRVAHARYDLAQETVRLYEQELLPLREQSLELARESFAAGKTGFLFVLEAQNELLAARSEYVEHLGQLARTIPALEAACGRPIAALTTPEE